MSELKIQTQSIRYPPRINLGSIQLIQTPENIGNQIAMFCSTVKGERPLLPDWGLPPLLFEKKITRTEISSLVLVNLNTYFRGVEFTIAVRDESSPGLLELEVNYKSPVGYGTVTITF